MKVQPQAFIAIEKSMTAALQGQWEVIARGIVDTLQPLLHEGKWAEAQEQVNRINVAGLIDDVRPKIEELCVTALIFGAHHATGSTRETAVVKKRVIPPQVRIAVQQLAHMVEQDGADYLRNYLHEQIEAAKRDDPRAHMQKDDVSVEQLEETGGLLQPEQGGKFKRKKQKLPKKDSKKTLYVRRDLLNAWEVIAWADKQGFKNVQRPEDMHVTVCYSKEPFDWTDLGAKQDNVTIVGGDRSLEKFGDAIVLRFDSQVLAGDHQDLRNAGASYDFDEYKPHVTLTWEGAPKALDKITPFAGNLQFGPEIFQPINKDWQDDHDEIVLRKADKALADMLNDAVLKGKKMPISTAAGLTTSRLISLGFLDQAQQDGQQQYQITEILDDRTCPVCQYMHGKIFDVGAQHARVMQALGTDDPADLKTIAPWPGQSGDDLAELKGMSLDEMQNAGYGSPPYHPGCRGFLVPLGEVDTTIPLGGDDGDQQEPIDDQPDLMSLFAGAEEAEETAAHVAHDWTPEEVEELQWKHLQINDPSVFKEANDAFMSGDYDECERITDEFLAGHAVAKEEPGDGPNGPKKWKRPQSPGGFEQDYDDVTNDTPHTFGALEEVTTVNDNTALLK